MATAPEKLAQSLEALKNIQDADIVAIKSSDLSRTHRERLLKNGFLKEVIKGWYVPSRPDEVKGESTAWYASFWDFCADYLTERFEDQWSLSPEQSLLLIAGNETVPRQLLVRAPKGRNKVTELIHDTSIMDVRAKLPDAADQTTVKGMRLFNLPSVLVSASPSIFEHYPTETRTALSLIKDSSDILPPLLEGGHSVIAGRLAGAFRNIGKARIASDIVKAMTAAGHTIREVDPFSAPSPIALTDRAPSPYVSRLKLIWASMREDVIQTLPAPPDHLIDTASYLHDVEEVYASDAYHSLSIEGYRVTLDLIERVKSGNWNPEHNKQDQEHIAALAARGYYQAFQSVKQSISAILNGANPGDIVDQEHGNWYLELFGPSVQAGLLKQSDLAGYRNGPVYIRQSKHVPPNRDAVRDLMPCLMDLLRQETDARARVVLGHFMFVYIHPYTDGNGRMGRFLMNAMLASGGYPWIVVPVDRREEYMEALEAASTQENIVPFAAFLNDLIQKH